MPAAASRLHHYAKSTSWPSPEVVPARRLKGSRGLTVGTGGIGRALARLLEPLEPEITAVNRSGTPMPGASSTVPTALLGEVVGQADWVVLAAPLTQETMHLFDQRMLGAMSRQAWLVNVARGGLVDTAGLGKSLGPWGRGRAA